MLDPRHRTLLKMLGATEDAGSYRGFWQLQRALDAQETLQGTLDAAEDLAEDVGIYRGRWTLR